MGVLSGVTLGMHLAAAVPVKEEKPKARACTVIAGGREPEQWEKYPFHRFLSNNLTLLCNDGGGCWKSRCTKVKDDDDKNKDENLCIYPVTVFPKADYPEDKIDGDLKIAKCLMQIPPARIIDAIESYYEGNTFYYNSSLPDLIPQKAREFLTL